MEITEYIMEVMKHIKPNVIASVDFDITLDATAHVNDTGSSHVRFTLTTLKQKNSASTNNMLKMLEEDEQS